MQGTKRLYETTFIINASLEDSQIESAVTRTQELITRNGGEIQAVNKWGRKRLAYSIQKKNNGFYVNIEYLGPGPLIGQIEHQFLLDENILRFLTIQVDKKAIKARMQAPPPPPEAPAVVKDEAAPQKEPLFADEGAGTVPNP